MRFRPTRVVGVTNKEELDSALLSADQVIVEGDDQLLSYAAAKASQDPEHSRVDIEIAGRSISSGRDALSNVRVTGDRNTTSAVEGVSNIEPLPSPPSIASTPPAPAAPALGRSIELSSCSRLLHRVRFNGAGEPMVFRPARRARANLRLSIASSFWD